MFFELKHKKAVINDINSDLIITYEVIRDNLNELIPLLKNYSKRNKHDDYYEIRDMERDENYGSLSNPERAARFIYLNKTCYNGLYRVNSQGLFNTPYGYHKNPAICNESVLNAVSEYLNKNEITIENIDFESSVKKCVKGDFVYFDPPYHSTGKTNFTGYQPGGFDEEEQERLFKVFKELTDRNVKCTLSNSSTDFIKALYSEFKQYTVKVGRSINSDPNGRGLVDEVIVVNWK